MKQFNQFTFAALQVSEMPCRLGSVLTACLACLGAAEEPAKCLVTLSPAALCPVSCVCVCFSIHYMSGCLHKAG